MPSVPRHPGVLVAGRTVALSIVYGVVLAGCHEAPPASDSRSAQKFTDPQEDRKALPIQPQKLPRMHEPVDASPDTRGVSFVDVAHECGLHYAWPEQPRPIPIQQTFGSGCAAFDADNDGWQDVLLVGDPHPALFRNEGAARFVNVTSESGLSEIQGDWTGCAIGDYNGDGLLDILLTGFHRLALYKNLGALRFEAATEKAGLNPDNRDRWGASAGFMDLDGDGWLDLVILNYVVYGPDSTKHCEFKPGVMSGCTPGDYAPENGEIWRNIGRGRFELVPETDGMQQTHGAAMVLAFTDLDGDGRIDFYIGNDGRAADLMHNLGEMRFGNIGLISGLSVSETTNTMSAMGADWGDFNRDGLLDLTVTNFQKLGFALFRNMGNNFFTDVAIRAGLTAATKSHLGFGAKWLDFDNDGWPDIAYANGHVYDNAPDVEGPEAQFRQRLSLFHNRQGSRFVDLVPALTPDVQRTMVARGSAIADFDNDGQVDLLVVDHEGPVMLLENRTESNHHWLKLDLRGAAPNIFAYGARVVGKAGTRTWLAEVAPASSYLSSSDPRIHWGLGEFAKLDVLVIRWPSGDEQTLNDV
ncbi:MAG: CRTAC1 family protein, partial [Planctomycetaceae bacterium]|nr:CRTAC1 family protein [Planctomycetaceae bacterium]